MFSKTLMSYFHNSTNRRSMENPDGAGQSKYPICGDRLSLELKLEEGRIQQALFQAVGCGPVVAVAALGTELLLHKTLEEARALTSFELDEKIGGLPASKRHAYLMFLDCLHQALDLASKSNGSMQERTSS